MNGDQRWLDQLHEDAIDPALPIIDPHHHLFDHPPWHYLLEDLRSDLATGHNVVATVFVECSAHYRPSGPEALRPVGETEFAEAIARCDAAGPSPRRVCAGIVAHADLMLGEAVRGVLEAHRDASPTRFRGIRYRTASDADAEPLARWKHPAPGIMREPAFRKGFAELGRLGLSFDAWLYHPQIADVAELAAAFPETTIILDHFGGPLGVGVHAGRPDEVFDAWRAAFDRLKPYPNVLAKLGGLGMAINGHGWHKRPMPPTSEEIVARTGHYHRYAIDALGPARCMFESNFPVDRISYSYAVLWNAFKRIAAGYSATERAQLFHGTAQRAYRLAA